MKQRLLLSLLLAMALVYFALPQLPLGVDGLGGIFAIAWLVFALMVIGGNLYGLLYMKKPANDPKPLPVASKKSARNVRRYSK